MHEFWAARVFPFPKKRASQGLTVICTQMYLKNFWTKLKSAYLRGPHSRDCISRGLPGYQYVNKRNILVSNVHCHCIANQHGIYRKASAWLDSSTHIYLLLEFESKVSVVLPLCTIIPWKLINGSMWSYGFVWPPCGMYF